jgi:hypothetical protein
MLEPHEAVRRAREMTPGERARLGQRAHEDPESLTTAERQILGAIACLKLN